MEGTSRLLHHLAPDTVLAEGGLRASELMDVLESLTPSLVGLGLYEYAPAGRRVPLVERILELGLQEEPRGQTRLTELGESNAPVSQTHVTPGDKSSALSL